MGLGKHEHEGRESDWTVCQGNHQVSIIISASASAWTWIWEWIIISSSDAVQGGPQLKWPRSEQKPRRCMLHFGAVSYSKLPKYIVCFNPAITFLVVATTGSLLLLPLSSCFSFGLPQHTLSSWEGSVKLGDENEDGFEVDSIDKDGGGDQCAPDEKSEADDERQTVQSIADCHPPEQTLPSFSLTSISNLMPALIFLLDTNRDPTFSNSLKVDNY